MSGSRDPGSRERSSDRSRRRRVAGWLADWNIHLRENWYRDVWLLAISIVCVWAALAAKSASNDSSRASHDALKAVRAVRTGRHVAVGVTCATLSAVSRAGYNVILGSGQPVSAREEHALEALGFPPMAARRAVARVQARSYVRSISLAVEKQVGNDAQLIRPDGTIRCARLELLADALR